MPRLTADGRTVEVEEGTRLVRAIEGMGIRIGHRCGGNARCTTCRVVFQAGEPSTMTRAEYAKLRERDLLGQVRLACQIVCEHDMEVRVGLTVDSEGWPDAGPEPAAAVAPEPSWFTPDELGREAADPERA